jgi:hypothetical protein
MAIGDRRERAIGGGAASDPDARSNERDARRDKCLQHVQRAVGVRRVDTGATSGRERLRHLQLVQLLAPRLRQPHE